MKIYKFKNTKNPGNIYLNEIDIYFQILNIKIPTLLNRDLFNKSKHQMFVVIENDKFEDSNNLHFFIQNNDKKQYYRLSLKINELEYLDKFNSFEEYLFYLKSTFETQKVKYNKKHNKLQAKYDKASDNVDVLNYFLR